MTREEVLNEFRAAGALLEGHFILSSGLRSPRYMQCARVMMDPRRGARLCQALARKIEAGIGKGALDLVVSPAMGGVVVGYELARQLGVESMFTEREQGKFAFRRGFGLPTFPSRDVSAGGKCARVLMAEDIVTTGLSSRECIACIEAHGGKVIAASCLIDRSEGEVELGVPLFSLAGLKVPAYEADKLPPELAAIPATKPGSRTLA